MQFLIQWITITFLSQIFFYSHPGKSYNIVIITFDMIHIFSECTLDSIASGFVVRFICFDISKKILITEIPEKHLCI